MHTHTKFLSQLSILTAIAVGFAFVLPLAASAATLAPASASCAVAGTPFLTLTQNITNDPDSGNHGNWATDAFTENVNVWMATTTQLYCANANTTNGTFITTGPSSPEHGLSLPAGINGTFTGGENYTFLLSLPLSPNYSTTSPKTISLPDSSTAGFSWWVNQVFPSVATSTASSYAATYSLTYVTPNGSTWTDADSASGGDVGDITPVFDATTGIGYATLQDAIDAASTTVADTIVLGANATTTAQITIDKAITIDGGGHTLYADFSKASPTDYTNNSAIGIDHSGVTIRDITLDGTSGGQTYPLQLHGVNVYESTGVNLDTVTIINFGGSGVVVNGSTVTATDLNTSGNVWNAVNVDPGSGVTLPSIFTLNSGTLADNTQIWSDGSNVNASSTVTVNAPGYTMYKVATTTAGFLWANRPLTNGVTLIDGTSTPTVYSTIQAAIGAASTTTVDTIVVGPGTYTGNLTIDRALILKGVQAGIDARNRSGNESILDGNLNVTAGSVTIDGFTINDPATDIALQMNGNSNETIENNIISNKGYVATFSGSNITFSQNAITNGSGVTSGIEANSNPGSTFNFLDNSFTGVVPTADITIIGTTTPITSNITVDSNTDNDGNTLIALFNTNTVTITNNTITNIGTAQNSAIYIGGNASNVTVENNTVTGAGKGVNIANDYSDGVNSDITVKNNSLTSNGYGVLIGATAASSSVAIIISDNKINGNTTADIENDVATLPIDATGSYWGSVGGPIGTDISGAGASTVSFAPWYTNAGMTSMNNGINSDNGTNATSTVTADIASTTSTTVGNVTVNIPAGTVVTGPHGWNGSIELPTVVTTTVAPTADNGYTNPQAVLSIEVGSSTAKLIFNPAVELTFVGQGNNSIGWSSNGGAFVPIDQTCDSATTPTTFSANGDCKITVGSNLIVWTKHFTTFTTYTQTAITPTPTPGNSGGGGGGGGISDSYGKVSNGYGGYTTPGNTVVTTPGSTVVTTPAQGQVLGAAAYNFTAYLRVGSKGADVTALQTLLTQEGFYTGPITGYFGVLTKAGVQKFQTANTISATGYVGPLTLAVLNKGAIPGTTTGTEGQATSTSPYIFTVNLRVGSRGAEVTAFQQWLTRKGIYSGPVTGYFGPLTLAAAKAFQGANGVPQTGYVGPLTRGVLNTAK